ncbi:butyrophilin-like protein 1 isoform X2 [Acanthopagrus latus]|uniref:butyrophilin-like protein 1 isoform X2 n=1 Tax=Acanthopagrus latus TaxID=8177 RepID=UPI00187C07BE|nr:butyrophilin-like protein 1 isoform X2 [Acanthopagrus latus]
MVNVQMTSSAMKLLPVACLCLLACCEDTFADENGPVVVKEGSDVVLRCSIDINVESKLFDWKKDGQKEVFMYDAGVHYNNGRTGQDEQFRGRVSHFKDELKHGNASIKIRNTKVADSGDYSCDFPRLQPRKRFNIKLVVGAAPEPSIKILDETKDWSLLQCVVRDASPQPKVEWKDSSGNILPAVEPLIIERGGRFYITLNTTVTKTDHYSCVVTQEEIGHQTDAETYVHINGAASEPSVTTIKTDGVTVLQCVVKGASPKPKVEWKDSSGNILPVKDLKETERGDSYDIVLQTTLTKTDNFRCVVTQEEINHQIYAEIDLNINGLSAGAIAGFVVLSLLLVVAIVGGVGGGLYIKHLKKENREKYEEKREPQTEPDSSTSLKESS